MAEGLVLADAQYSNLLLEGNSCQALNFLPWAFCPHFPQIASFVGRPVYFGSLKGVEKLS
jgi:hypothetical protein